MIIDKGLVTFFEISECGLYEALKKNRTSLPVGMGLKDTLEGIINWAKGRSFENTLPVDIPEESSRKPILFKSYEIDQNTGDFILVFWECMGESDGTVGAVVSNSSFGDSSDDTVNIASEEHDGRKLTPGHPMYYWFIPEYGVFASINFGHSTANTEGVASYIRAAIRHRVSSSYRKVIEKTNDQGEREIKQIFFRDNDGKSLKYLFNHHMVDIQVHNIDLDAEANKITHLVVKERISKNKTTTRDPAFKLWGKVESAVTARQLLTRDVEVVSETRTTGNELRSLLKLYNQEMQQGNSGVDIGFRTSYESKTTRWFSRYLSRPHLRLDKAQKKNRASYTAKYVLKQLSTQRDDLLKNVTNELQERKANGR